MVYKENLHNFNLPQSPRPVSDIESSNGEGTPSGTWSSESTSQNVTRKRHKGKQKEVFILPLRLPESQPLYHSDHATANLAQGLSGSRLNSSLPSIVPPDGSNEFLALNGTSSFTESEKNAPVLSTHSQVSRNDPLDNSGYSPTQELFNILYTSGNAHDQCQTWGAGTSNQVSLPDADQMPSGETSLPIRQALNRQRQDMAEMIDCFFRSDLGLFPVWLLQSDIPSLYIPAMSNADRQAIVDNAIERSFIANQLCNGTAQTNVEIRNSTNTYPQSIITGSHTASATADCSPERPIYIQTQPSNDSGTDTKAAGIDNTKSEQTFTPFSSSASSAEGLVSANESVLQMEDSFSSTDSNVTQASDSLEAAVVAPSRVPEALETDCNVELDSTPIYQRSRFPEDLYTPNWVRFSGRERQGRCERCFQNGFLLHWFTRRSSSYLYHMLNAHGIVHATGREFPLPTDIRILDNGSREAFCQYCHRMVAAYSTRSKAPTSPWAPWYRHCNNCHPQIKMRKRSWSESEDS